MKMNQIINLIRRGNLELINKSKSNRSADLDDRHPRVLKTHKCEIVEYLTKIHNFLLKSGCSANIYPGEINGFLI